MSTNTKPVTAKADGLTLRPVRPTQGDEGKDTFLEAQRRELWILE